MNKSELVQEYRLALKASMLPYLADAIDSLSKESRYEELLGEILILLKRGFAEKDWPKWAAGGTMKFNRSVIQAEIQFRETNQYSHSRDDFEVVNDTVYKDEQVMEGYYLVGLLLSYFTWVHQYWMLKFFQDAFLARRGSVESIMEFGVGHGLFSLLASRHWRESKITVTDISPHSLAFARRLLIADGKVDGAIYQQFDVMKSKPLSRVDRLICSEVLEHVPDPLALLRLIRESLQPQGYAFVTAAINSPQVDHIYLFTSREEVEDMVKEAGLVVLSALPVVHPNQMGKKTPPTVLAMVLAKAEGA